MEGCEEGVPEFLSLVKCIMKAELEIKEGMYLDPGGGKAGVWEVCVWGGL